MSRGEPPMTLGEIVAAEGPGEEANAVRPIHLVTGDGMPWQVRVRLDCIAAVLKMPADAMNSGLAIMSAAQLEDYALNGYTAPERD